MRACQARRQRGQRRGRPSLGLEGEREGRRRAGLPYSRTSPHSAAAACTSVPVSARGAADARKSDDGACRITRPHGVPADVGEVDLIRHWFDRDAPGLIQQGDARAAIGDARVTRALTRDRRHGAVEGDGPQSVVELVGYEDAVEHRRGDAS